MLDCFFPIQESGMTNSLLTARAAATAARALPLVLALAGCATDGSIVLRDMGSFHVGGRDVVVSGRPVTEIRRTPTGPLTKLDPNGTYQVEQTYVQYFLPANRRGAVPLLLWHGGGLTGASFETTPDGRPGWLNYFVRQGWDTYNSDAVERGRSGFASPEIFAGQPIFLTKTDPYERFRIGGGAGTYSDDPARRKLLPGNQFPVEAYDNFTRQLVPRWLSTDQAITDAYIALVDKVCPCVIVIHSQAGLYAFKAAQARPDKVKALVVVEPAGIGDADQAAALKHIPVLAVFGDYFNVDARWATLRKTAETYFDQIRQAGGSVRIADLPQMGIRGNGHMLIMDRNNLEVAALIQKWLAEQPGLYR
jgi:pimeloyl-ACP methyl ester carboxylesterase